MTTTLDTRDRRIEDFKVRLFSIAKLMGARWTAKPNVNVGAWVIGSVVESASGADISFGINSNGERVEIWGGAPQGFDNRDKPASITVAITRPDEQIANEIKRRYLNAYLAWHQGRCEARDRHVAHTKSNLDRVQKLAAISGLKVQNADSERPSIHFSFGEIGHAYCTVSPASDGTWYIQGPSYLPDEVVEFMAKLAKEKSNA